MKCPTLTMRKLNIWPPSLTRNSSIFAHFIVTGHRLLITNLSRKQMETFKILFVQNFLATPKNLSCPKFGGGQGGRGRGGGGIILHHQQIQSDRGGGTQQSFIPGDCAPRSKPSPFYMPSLTAKVTLSHINNRNTASLFRQSVGEILKDPFKYLKLQFFPTPLYNQLVEFLSFYILLAWQGTPFGWSSSV